MSAASRCLPRTKVSAAAGVGGEQKADVVAYCHVNGKHATTANLDDIDANKQTPPILDVCSTPPWTAIQGAALCSELVVTAKC